VRPGGLTSPEAWVGVWVRQLGGPNTSGRTVHYGPWHRVERVDAERLYPSHGRGEPYWPFMGTRLEVFRPGFDGAIPPEGRICSRCVAIRYPLRDTRPAERQEYVDEEAAGDSWEEMIDAVAKRVVELTDKRL